MAPPTTILLIPGAFARASSLEKLRAALEAAGIDAHLVSLLSVDPVDPANTSCAADAEHVRKNYIQPLLDQGKDVIIFAHSYGGIVGGGAALGLKKENQASVVGLILHSAMLLTEGSSLQDTFGGQIPPFILQDQPSKGLCVKDDAPGVTHSLLSFKSPAPKPAWTEPSFADRLVYIRTTKGEQTIAVAIQDRVIADSGVRWDVRDIHGSHEAYETHTDEVVAIIRECTDKWSS